MRAPLLILALLIAGTTVVPATDGPTEASIRALIDRLPEIGKPGAGYSGIVTAWGFLPYGEEELGPMLLQPERRQPAPALRDLVAAGAPAIPLLAAALDDARPIALPPISGMEWIGYLDEYDFNRRLVASPAEGVNLDYTSAPGRHPAHQLTVGDLCFLALGEIVNRSFMPARYQPSGGVVINSPTASPKLHAAAVAEWASVDATEHRRRLIEDFLFADSEWRREGAATRIAFYYPDALPALVVAHLHTPTYDVIPIEHFVRSLYPLARDRAKPAIDEFLAKRDPIYREGVLVQLFDDLKDTEATEEHRMSAPSDYGARPREILIDAFGFPPGIRHARRPAMWSENSSERSRLIRSFSHDTDAGITAAIVEILRGDADDDYLALGCFPRAIDAGHADDILAFCERRLPLAEGFKPRLQRVRDAIIAARAAKKPLDRTILPPGG